MLLFFCCGCCSLPVAVSTFAPLAFILVLLALGLITLTSLNTPSCLVPCSQDLSLGRLATAFALLRLPRMPEVKKAKGQLENFTPSQVGRQIMHRTMRVQACDLD